MKQSRLSRYIPKCKGYRFALICIVICIVTDVCGEIFFPGDVLRLTGTKAWVEWILRMVVFVSLPPAMGAFILFGIRHLRREGISAKRLIVPFCGIIVCMSYAFMWGYMHKAAGKMQGALEFDDWSIAKFDQGLASGEIDMETYSKASLSMAEHRFLMDGSITEYTAPDGEKILYEPNEPERELYTDIQRTKDFFGNLQKSSLWSVYLWVSVALLSTILGLVTRVEHKRCGV